MACAHFLRQRGYDLLGLFVDYGQSAREHAADQVAKALQVPLRTGVVRLGTQ